MIYSRLYFGTPLHISSVTHVYLNFQISGLEHRVFMETVSLSLEIEVSFACITLLWIVRPCIALL
ncbi:hypothetical protein HanPSC8_Chr09g0402041 [Helianthus annuus]|nr:hypothetical protein HanPSC8_Chr09g0402041 [Helianthus annuus]